MSLMERLTRLLRADAHAALERMEDPAQNLELAIRDMQDELDALGLKRSQVAARLRDIERSQAELDERLRGIDADLDMAFNSERDDLARDTVQRKLAAQSERAKLNLAAERLHDRRDVLDHGLKVRREKLEGVRRDAALARAALDAGNGHGDRHASAFGDSEIELALLRERQARTVS